MKKILIKNFSNLLSLRDREAHKGNFGHVLIVGGDLGYSGSVSLVARAALRVGAGLVSVATRREHAAKINITQPEIMSHAVEAPVELKPLLERASVLVVGPGLGKSAWSVMMLEAVLTAKLPLVLDADGLNLIANFPSYRDNWILTPHPKEAARLLKKTVVDIQQDRLAAVRELVTSFGGVAVLKGAGTLVADGKSAAICSAGNPGMATAGMGDVLSGVIGGWLAQGASLVDAAELGVLIHAKAGDLAANKGERGMVASDLLPYLRKLVN